MVWSNLSLERVLKEAGVQRGAVLIRPSLGSGLWSHFLSKDMENARMFRIGIPQLEEWWF
jgi:hypothetical protein